MTNWRAPFYLLISVGVLLPVALLAPVWSQAVIGCAYWVAPPPTGNDGNPGTAAAPWATMAHAAEVLPDNTCTVWFQNGEYAGEQRLNRRFTTPTTFRAVHPYRAILHHNGLVLSLSGATNITLEGFIFRHSGPSAGPLVVQVDGSEEGFGEQITLRNNIFHDSYNNDLLKIVSGARFILVENNVFYNQGPTDEHIDVNSVTDIVIQDNIFFNDHAGSGRDNPSTSHSYITIKDSDEGADGLEGSERITVQRNIFLNWEGGRETLIQVGNDGKPYHEAKDVRIENNLFIGNAPNDAYSILGLRGVRDVIFANNTAIGDFPSSAYAMWVDLTGANLVNENLIFTNNIWADPTGSMGSYYMENDDNEFSKGDPAHAANVVLDNNLYWNGLADIPGGDLLVPQVDDAHALVTDPRLHTFQEAISLPRWNGSAFPSGNVSIREEFIRLVTMYGRLDSDSQVIGAANPAMASAADILGRPRSATPDIGAYEYYVELTGLAGETELTLNWSPPNEPNASELMLTYSFNGKTAPITGIDPTTREFTLTDLQPQTVYSVHLTVLDASGATLAKSDPITIETTDHNWCLPLLFR
jgi:hypothetical protein